MAQRIENFAGHVRISSLSFDRGFLNGRFWWWVRRPSAVKPSQDPPTSSSFERLHTHRAAARERAQQRADELRGAVARQGAEVFRRFGIREVYSFGSVGPGACRRNSDLNLLKRMTLAIPDVRPRVIDEELFRLLDDFRTFRHGFRHAYGFELDREREKLVASRRPPAGELFRNQVEGFLRALEDG